MNEENKNIKENKEEIKQDSQENNVENNIENKEDHKQTEEVSNQENITSIEVLSENETNEILNYNLEEFNTIVTTEGNLKLNEEIYMQMKITNLYLNLILLAVTTCFLYYVVSKALKKLFYINI